MTASHLILGVNGLRAVAVLAVVLFHLAPQYFPRGYLGVDVFFVISGFILSHSIFIENTKYENQRKSSLADFFSRRVLRLAPQLLLMIWVVSLLGVFFLPQAWISDSHQQSAIWALLGLSNWYFGSGIEAYFEPRAEYNPFLHTWSLGIEVQFYFLFGCLAIGLLWLVPNKKRALMLLMICIAIISIFFSILQYLYLKQDIFYATAYRLWEIGLGVFLRWRSLEKTPLQKPPTNQGCMPIFAMGLLLFAPTKALSDGLWPHLLACLFTAALLVSLTTRRKNASRLTQFLNSNPLSVVGNASYAIYVWHWPVIVYMRWTIGIEEKWHFLAAIVLIFFISIITYRYYENPLRASKILRSKPVTVLIIFCSLILFSWWGIQKLYQNKPTLSFSSTFPAALWRGDNQSDNKYPIQCNLKTENLGLGKAQKTIFISSCSPEQRHGQENFTVFVAGDSHATAYMAALRGYAGASGNTVVIYSLPGCPFIDLIRSKAKIGAECLDIGTQIWNDIASQAQSKDVLFLPSLRLQRMVDQWPLTREILERSQITKRDRQEALDLAISYLETSQALNLRVVIEAPKPIFRTPTFRCADSWTKINPICKNGNFIDREEILAIRQPVMDSIHVLQSKFANISVWDPLPIICPEGHTQCGLWRDDKPLYFDADHLSGYGNTVIFESLRKAMDGSER